MSEAKITEPKKVQSTTNNPLLNFGNKVGMVHSGLPEASVFDLLDSNFVLVIGSELLTNSIFNLIQQANPEVNLVQVIGTKSTPTK